MSRARFSFLASAAFLTFAAPTPVSAQEFTNANARPPGDPAGAALRRHEPVSEQRQLALGLARGLGDKIAALGNAEARVRGWAQLADVMWEDDEHYSRRLFEEALDSTRPAEEGREAKSLPALRRSVIMRIARRDPAWAKRLIDELLEDDPNRNLRPGVVNIDTALRLLEHDPGSAVEFASRSLQRGVDHQTLVTFIKELRLKDQEAADRLFLQTLHEFAHSAAPDAGHFALLGTYLFTSPSLANPNDSSAMMLTRVGNFLIPDITADRPGAARPLVRAYLETAIGALSRRHADPRQTQMTYAVGHLLLPKARKFAPDLVAPLGAGMAALQSSVPPNLTQDAAYANMYKLPENPDERLRSAEKISDPQGRDIAYFEIAYGAWRRNDFKLARTAAAKIDNRETAARLSALNDFGEGAWLLKRGPQSLSEAARLAHRLPPGLERSVIFLGIAQAARKSEDAAQAQEALALALKSAGAVDDASRPYLTLAAAGQLAELDPVAAASTLTQAVKELNALDAPAPPQHDWQRRVECGPLALWFPIQVEGVDLSFERSFAASTSAQPESGIAQAEALRDERLRAQAFVRLAAAILKGAKEEAQPAERVVRVGEDGMRKSAAKTVMPAYPEDARKKKEQGAAVIELQYDGKGDVTEVAVLEAPAQSIGQAVVDAAKQWKFTPSATAKGEPVSVRGKLTFYFTIDKDGQGRVENPKQYR
jgi:TonB family protein